MNHIKLSRRKLLLAGSSAALLQACSPSLTGVAVNPLPTLKPTEDNRVHLFASSGYCADPTRVERGLARLQSAGFYVDNPEIAYRRHRRFAGSDAERTADLQDLLKPNVPMPKLLLGVRGGYGATRLLSQIDWPSLASKMREYRTMLFGFSDICAIQAALLAHNMMSFAGPMLYSEFGKDPLPMYTMQHFIQGSTNPNWTIEVQNTYTPTIRAEGIFWGGNLSVLSSMVGSPYFPDINGGILFLEDVGEQPYRIERMLYSLHLAGVLQKQQAIVLGDFRMGNIVDVYDESYDLYEVIQQMRNVSQVPILTGFPFGHILHKATFPLGAPCRLENTADGYRVQFFDYPTLNADNLQLNQLITNDLSLEQEWV